MAEHGLPALERFILSSCLMQHPFDNQSDRIFAAQAMGQVMCSA